MAWRHIKRRSSRRFALVQRLLWPAIFVIAGFSIWFALPSNHEAASTAPFSANGPGASVRNKSFFSSAGASPTTDHRDSPSRVVYLYSVIPGGVKNVAELRNAIAKDPVVSAHYATFQLSRARIIRVNRARSVHVSYRLGNHVYWTKRTLKLAKGERLITDGVLTARTRCGNLISAKLLPPISPNEPSVQQMDIPEVPRDFHVQIGSGPQPGPPLTQASSSGPPHLGNGYGPVFYGPWGLPVLAYSRTPNAPVVTVPEPGTLGLLLTGLLAFILFWWWGGQRIRHRDK